MEKFPVLQNELERLEKLYSYSILDMEPEDRFDDLTKLAASILDVPICLITLMDADWQTFISNVGTEMKGNHRELAFCKYCVVQEDILEITDTTKDERVSQNPLVVNEPNLRYYVGAPLIDEEGYIIGTVCGYDLKPRQMSAFQKSALRQITSTVMRLIHLRKVDLDQKKYKGIFNLSQDLLCILSKDGYLKEFNPAIWQLLDTTREELLNREFSNWIHPDDIDNFQKLIQHSEETVILTRLNFRLKKSNGDYVTIQWSCYFDAQLSIIVVSGHDITESLLHQSELEAAVIRANEAVEMKDQFLSDMSHEIRTPLASIVGFNELLSTSDLSDDQKSFAEAVDIAAEQLMSIVNEVLDVYKFSSHEIALDPSPEDLRTILDKIKKLYSLKAAAKNIDLHLHYDERIPKNLNIDRTRLTQIISNLISNAIKFTSIGSVTLSAELVDHSENGSQIRFSIIDTGIGIDPSRQEAIFDRFTQADVATWKQYGGTGLGLSIAKLLVELHGAELKIDSVLNQGTTFHFEIAFSSSDLSKMTSSQSQSARADVPALNGIRILVAEDNKHLQILSKTFIERNGGILKIVANGKKAIDYLKENEVDVILIDMQMPVINGMEAAKYIREELNLTCRIIGCSANLLDLQYAQEDRAHLDEFITKPYTEFGLISEILRQFELKTPATLRDDFTSILNELRLQEGEELVNEFESIFKNRIPKDIADLVNARNARDFTGIQRKAHFLSTTLITLKFTQGLDLATDIGKSIEANHENLTLKLTDQFIDYLNGALTEIR